MSVLYMNAEYESVDDHARLEPARYKPVSALRADPPAHERVQHPDYPAVSWLRQMGDGGDQDRGDDR